MATKAKAAKEMTIDNVLEELFNVKFQQTVLKEREAELQAKVDQYSDEHINDFVEGEMALEVGVIKIQQNPPKLVHEDTEKALSTAERAELTLALSDEYKEVKPNIKKMLMRMNGDKLLAKLFKAKKITIKQESRYAAKSY